MHHQLSEMDSSSLLTEGKASLQEDFHPSRGLLFSASYLGIPISYPGSEQTSSTVKCLLYFRTGSPGHGPGPKAARAPGGFGHSLRHRMNSKILFKNPIQEFMNVIN